MVAPTGGGVLGPDEGALSDLGAQPRPASDWSGAGDRMKGEWAWEWAACVPSG